MSRGCRVIGVAACLSLLLHPPTALPSDDGLRRAALPSIPGQESLGRFQPDEIIVELRPHKVAAVRTRLDRRGRLPGARTGVASLDALSARHGVTEIEAALSEATRGGVTAPSRLGPFLRLKLGEDASVFDALEAYRDDPTVASAQLNYIYAPDVVPNDSLIGQQYAHGMTMAYEGWDIETGVAPIVIAVIGVGVDGTHPDLASKLVAGWDFVGGDPDPSPVGDGHETSVAGVAAAATGNAIGIAGVCWECSIMPLRISYTSLHVAQAVDFARTHGARIVNMSFGNYDPTKYGPDTIVETAIRDAHDAGMVLVASAGNDLVSQPRYPGALAEVLAVAATDENDYMASFSNYGGWVDVAAPGNGVISTRLSGAYGPCTGTSFSAPYVSGLAGLILSQDPSLGPHEVGIIIKSTADEILTSAYIGRGRVNVQGALSQGGLPAVFADIGTPWYGQLLQEGGTLAITGTVLGDSYVLESRDYTEGWLEEPQNLPPWVTIASGGQTIAGTLATWDLGDVPPGHYLLRLTARRGAQVAEHSITVVRTSPQLPGWPVSIGSSVTGEPTLADVDGDGTLEVLVGRSDGFVSILRHDGTSLPGWPASAGGGVYAAPSAGDIDGDGDLEVVAATRFNARVMAWHHNGAPIAGFPVVTGSSWIMSDPVLASFDADNALEIVVVNQNGTVHVLNAPGGAESPGWPRVVASPVPMSPAVGDIDGDGVLDIVVRSEMALNVLRANGTPAAGWPRAATLARGAPAVADLNGDRNLEIIDAALERVIAWRSDGTTLFDRGLFGIDSDNGPGVGDITGDGRPEIFYGNFGNLARGINDSGFGLPGWPVLIGHSISAGMIIADLDGDAELEAGVPGWDRGVYIVNPNGSFSRRPIVVGDELQDTPAVGDLDGDGQSELIVGTLDGRLSAFRLPGGPSSANAEWPMHQADAMHTGHHRFRDHYTDSDGDADVDRYDCAPADPSIHGGATEICNGIDDDCSGLVDDLPDMDGDGHPSCQAMLEDCDDLDPGVWGSPTAVMDFQLLESSGSMVWSSPLDAGAMSVVYDVIRAGAAEGFPTEATCIESNVPIPSAQDPDDPSPGQVLYYLVRAQNACPSPMGYGSLGTDSAGNPRSGPYCP